MSKVKIIVKIKIEHAGSPVKKTILLYYAIHWL